VANADWFKATIAVAALMAGGGVGYYFGIYLPERDRAAAQERRAAEQAAKEERESAAATQAREATIRQRKVSGCLAIADFNYSASWESNCEGQAKENRSQYADCIGQGLGKSFCHSLHGDFQTSGCSLPQSLARSLEAERDRAKDLCYRQP
jgi:hypothetical protein